MSSIAEQLTVLRSSTRDCMARIYKTQKDLSQQAIPFYREKALEKVVKAVVSKYPQFNNIDTVAGFDLLKRDCIQYLEVLGPAYTSLVDWVEYRSAIMDLLEDMARNATMIKFQTTPQLLVGFMNLFVDVIRMDVMVSRIPDLRLISGLYALAFQANENRHEPTFGVMSTLIQGTDEPFKALQETMLPLCETVGSIMDDVMMSIYRTTEPDTMRANGELSLHTDKKSQEQTQPVTDQFVLELQHINDYYRWMTWSYLVCPSLLADPNHMGMLKVALSDAFVFHVFRDMTINMHAEYETMFGNYKTKALKLSNSANKKILQECAVTSVTTSALKHMQVRDVLRYDMSHTLALLKRKPGLLPPKLPIVFASLALARKEIMWYIMHVDTTPPKVKGVKNFDADSFFDPNFSALLYLADSLTDLVQKYLRVIQLYYIDYLSNVDADALQTEVEPFGEDFSQNQMSMFKQMWDTARKLKSEDATGSEEDMAALELAQLNWLRLLVQFVTNSHITILKIPKVVQSALLLDRHARYARNTMDIVREDCTLGELCWFPAKLALTIDDCLHSASEDPLHVVACARIARHFPSTGSSTISGEKASLALTAIEFAEDTCAKISARIAAVIAQISGNKGYNSLAMQLLPTQAALVQEIKYKRAQARSDEKKKKKSGKNKEEDLVMPPEPGSESRYGVEDDNIQALALYKQSLVMFCNAIKSVGNFVIWDTVVSPVEYLREQLVFCVATFVMKACFLEENKMQRPTLLEAQVNTYLSVIKSVQHYVGLDVDAVVHMVFSGHFCLPAFAGTDEHLNNFKQFRDEAGESEKTLVWAIASWYMDLVFDRIPKERILYSGVQQGFVTVKEQSSGKSKKNEEDMDAFRAEEYCDLEELKALVRLVGASGVRCLDYHLVRRMSDMLDPIKEILSKNETTLKNLVDNFPFEPSTSNNLAAMQGTNELMAFSIHIGCGLKFRKLLRQAQEEVAMEHAPLVHSLLSAGLSQVENGYMYDKEWKEVSAMALDAGLDVMADPVLVSAWRQFNVDEADNALWLYLPYIYASAFTTQIWTTSQYSTKLAAHANNTHVVGDTIHTLITTLIPLNKGATATLVKKTLKNFVEVSAVVLLRMTRSPPENLASMFVFLDLFVQASPVLTMNYLENACPYPLLRSTYTEIFKSQLVLSEEELNAKAQLTNNNDEAGSSSGASSSSSGAQVTIM